MKQPAKKVIRWKRIVGVPIGLGLDAWNDMQAAEIESVVVCCCYSLHTYIPNSQFIPFVLRES
jgi:hypothetical protein